MTHTVDCSARQAREELPNRRASETIEFWINGLRFIATVSRFADGRVGEIFLSNHKTGSQADACARDAAITCSIALQYGVPLEILRGAVLRDRLGVPSTALGFALDLVAEGEIDA
jgi:ribonucleoside-diphosphate reductase alpha chain